MEKPIILILHGWGSSGQAFSPLAKILSSKGFNVHNPDLPGFGSNSKLDRAYSLSDYVDFVKKYIKEERLGRFFLLGYSFGGRIAIKIATSYPEQIKLLILTGVPGLNPVRSGKIIFFRALAKLGRFITYPFPSSLQTLLKKLLYRLSGSGDYLRAEGFLKQTLQAVVKEDLGVSMRQIRIPTFLLWGENDKTVPVAVAKKMLREIPGSILQVIPKTGHKLPYEESQIFARHLLNKLHHYES